MYDKKKLFERLNKKKNSKLLFKYCLNVNVLFRCFYLLTGAVIQSLAEFNGNFPFHTMRILIDLHSFSMRIKLNARLDGTHSKYHVIICIFIFIKKSFAKWTANELQ